MWSELIGKKIVAFRGLTYEHSKKLITPLEFVLFDDNETFIELHKQDPYDYHDCADSARILDVHKDVRFWAMMFDKENGFTEPDNLGGSPF